MERKAAQQNENPSDELKQGLLKQYTAKVYKVDGGAPNFP